MSIPSRPAGICHDFELKKMKKGFHEIDQFSLVS